MFPEIQFFLEFQLCWPVTSQPLVLPSHVVPLWKALISGCWDQGIQGYGRTFKVWQTLSKAAILCSKMANCTNIKSWECKFLSTSYESELRWHSKI